MTPIMNHSFISLFVCRIFFDMKDTLIGALYQIKHCCFDIFCVWFSQETMILSLLKDHNAVLVRKSGKRHKRICWRYSFEFKEDIDTNYRKLPFVSYGHSIACLRYMHIFHMLRSFKEFKSLMTEWIKYLKHKAFYKPVFYSF